MRLLGLACMASLCLAASAAAADQVRATMTTSSIEPLVGEPWRYTITVKDSDGSPLAARVRLQVVRGDVVVGCRKRTAIVRCSGPRSGRWIAFKGTHTATIVWPRFSVGVGLTFKATILSDTRTLLLGAPVKSRALP